MECSAEHYDMMLYYAPIDRLLIGCTTPFPLLEEMPSLSVTGCSRRRLNELDGAVEEKEVAEELDCWGLEEVLCY